MARIAFGGDLEDHTVITQPDQRHRRRSCGTRTMLGAAEVYARRQPGDASSRRSSSPGRWRRSPSPGVAAQTLAEALAGMTFTQLDPAGRAGDLRVVRIVDVDADRRADVRHAGAGARAVHDRRARPPARRAVPHPADRCARSKIPDAQAAYESAATLQPTVLAGINFVLHAAGWLEGGLADRLREVHHSTTTSCGMMADVRQGRRPVRRTARRSTRSATTGRASTSSARAHTFANFETAFYRSNVADNTSFEQWTGGRRDRCADARQRRSGRSVLAEYEMPPMDDAIAEELNEFVDRRKQELPDEFA